MSSARRRAVTTISSTLALSIESGGEAPCTSTAPTMPHAPARHVMAIFFRGHGNDTLVLDALGELTRIRSPPF
jgi:hypothetical protein